MHYHVFPKPLGPLLAAVEIASFILLPIWHELKVWGPRMPRILRWSRTWTVLVLLIIGVGIAFVPWDTRVRAQGLPRPHQHFPLVAPGAAQVQALPLNNGQWVEAGQVLIRLTPPDLAFQRQSAQARAGTLAWQASAAGVDPKLREQQQIINAAQGKVQAELAGIEQEQTRYTPKAPFAGRLYLSHPDLSPGTWVGKNETPGVLADTRRWRVETYLPEAALYRVTLALETDYAPAQPQILRGTLVIHGAPKAWMDEFTRSAAALFVREAGF